MRVMLSRERGVLPMNRGAITALLANCLTPVPLTAAAREQLRATLSSKGTNWTRLLQAASTRLVAPALPDELAGKGLWDLLPADARDYLETVRDLNAHRNTELLSIIEGVARVLNQAGIEPLLLKGSGCLATELHPHRGSRVLRDIDILVPPAQFAAAAHALEGAGWFPPVPLPSEMPLHAHSQIGFTHCRGLKLVELHQELLPAEQQHRLAASDLLRAGVSLTLGNGARVLVLPPLETVIVNVVHHQIMHGCFQSGMIDVRALYDLALLHRRYGAEIDWPALDTWFDRRGWRPELYAYLALGQELFAMPRSETLQPRWREHLAAGYAKFLYRMPMLCLPARICFLVCRRIRADGWKTVVHYARRITQRDFYPVIRRVIVSTWRQLP